MGGERDGGPYPAVARLWAWATAHWRYIDGRLTLAGIDASSLSAPRLLNVVYAMLVDNIDGLVDRGKAMTDLDAELVEPLGTDPLAPNPDEWGTGPRARRRASAMMDLTGPPPGWPPKPVEEDA